MPDALLSELLTRPSDGLPRRDWSERVQTVIRLMRVATLRARDRR